MLQGNIIKLSCIFLILQAPMFPESDLKQEVGTDATLKAQIRSERKLYVLTDHKA